MILIIESGSTKADWICIDQKGAEVSRWSLMGFNPYFHSADFIGKILKNHSEISKISESIEQVWFYGAGCSSKKLNKIIFNGLRSVFRNSLINVDHDLKAAAFATYDNCPHVACILGTGSNSCYFDGKKIIERVPALAYILGDEGSASSIGKRLCADWIYGIMPNNLSIDFTNSYKTSKEEILDKVYNQKHANVYLASFSRFAGEHSKHPYIKQIISDGFKKFLEIHVLCFSEVKKGAPVNFVGSVAKAFESLLREQCLELNINYGRTQAKPVNLLVEYHLKTLRILNKELKV